MECEYLASVGSSWLTVSSGHPSLCLLMIPRIIHPKAQLRHIRNVSRPSFSISRLSIRDKVEQDKYPLLLVSGCYRVWYDSKAIGTLYYWAVKSISLRWKADCWNYVVCAYQLTKLNFSWLVGWLGWGEGGWRKIEKATSFPLVNLAEYSPVLV